MAKVAVAQMLSGENLESNLEQAALLVEQAKSEGAELLLLPENFAMLDSKALIRLAASEERSSLIERTLSGLASRNKLWVIAGSVPLLVTEDEQIGGRQRVYASSLVYDESGQRCARYDKIHLFDVDVDDQHAAYRESDFIQHGSGLTVVDSPAGTLGLSICYDLRFPEQYQALRERGAEILTVPSAFTAVTGEAHWEVLLRARAIETQCYVLAANQGGQHSATRSSWGHSMIISPWGEVIAERVESGPGIIVADIDLESLHNRRKAMPVMQHRLAAKL